MKSRVMAECELIASVPGLSFAHGNFWPEGRDV